MMNLIRRLLLVTALLCCATPALAATYYLGGQANATNPVKIADNGDMRSCGRMALLSCDETGRITIQAVNVDGGCNYVSNSGAPAFSQLTPRIGTDLATAIANFASVQGTSFEFMTQQAPKTAIMVKASNDGRAVIQSQLANGSGMAEIADFVVPKVFGF